MKLTIAWLSMVEVKSHIDWPSRASMWDTEPAEAFDWGPSSGVGPSILFSRPMSPFEVIQTRIGVY